MVQIKEKFKSTSNSNDDTRNSIARGENEKVYTWGKTNHLGEYCA